MSASSRTAARCSSIPFIIASARRRRRRSAVAPAVDRVEFGIYGGKHWVLNSGTGEIGWIERGASVEESRRLRALFRIDGPVGPGSSHNFMRRVHIGRSRLDLYVVLSRSMILQSIGKTWISTRVTSSPARQSSRGCRLRFSAMKFRFELRSNHFLIAFVPSSLSG